jgi:uncharacterized protein (DUF1684 family)
MKRYSLLLILLSLLGCEIPKRSAEEIANYKSEIESWQKDRVEKLVGPNGWVNVRGLFWLKEGINSFGADATNDIVFPEDKIAGKAGFFLLRDTIVSMELLPGAKVTSEGVPVYSQVIFHPDSAKSKVLESGPLQWMVIKRNDKIGIRLRDLETEKLKEFKGIESFDPNLDWKLEARMTAVQGKKIDIVNVLGQTYSIPVVGTLTFSYQGKKYSLDAIDEDGELFIIYADATNGKDTYGSGRYLYADKPETGDVVVLDFNKSRNPPCAFTEFATCLLPPKQNILPFEVTAGEKAYH